MSEKTPSLEKRMNDVEEAAQCVRNGHLWNHIARCEPCGEKIYVTWICQGCGKQHTESFQSPRKCIAAIRRGCDK